MARTYLERHLDEFDNASREELIKHGLRALKESLAQDKELSVENTSVGVVGKASDGKRKLESFKLYDGAEVGALLDASLESTDAPAEGRQGTDTGAATQGDSMDVDP